MARFFGTVPRNVMAAQGLMVKGKGSPPKEKWVMLTSGCAPPLSEDWCLRGMEWVGRKVYERGFWKSGEERRAEIEVLDEREGGDLTDGIIEDEDEDEGGQGDGGGLGVGGGKVVRCAVDIVAVVDGFRRVEGTRVWEVEGPLQNKVVGWKEADHIAREGGEVVGPNEVGGRVNGCGRGRRR
jgi:protein SMG6